MNEYYNNGRVKPRNGNMYNGRSSSSPSPEILDKEGPWKSLGSSMNAISFGFVATAILISMFLIMAIFEHLFRPNASPHEESRPMESSQLHKLATPHIVSALFYFLTLISTIGCRDQGYIINKLVEMVMWPRSQRSSLLYS